jgi:hypothetical protein
MACGNCPTIVVHDTGDNPPESGFFGVNSAPCPRRMWQRSPEAQLFRRALQDRCRENGQPNPLPLLPSKHFATKGSGPSAMSAVVAENVALLRSSCHMNNVSLGATAAVSEGAASSRDEGFRRWQPATQGVRLWKGSPASSVRRSFATGRGATTSPQSEGGVALRLGHWALEVCLLIRHHENQRGLFA